MATESPTGDRALIQAARAGDSLAFERLLGRHAPGVVTLLARVLGDRELALDLAQETFLKAFSSLERFDATRSFRVWVSAIAWNLVRLGLWRRGQRVEARLKLERDATRARQVHVPFLFRYESRAEKRRLSLLPFGSLYHERTSHFIGDHGAREEHGSDHDLSLISLILNLIHYHSDPKRRELRLLWFFPLRFESRTRE